MELFDVFSVDRKPCFLPSSLSHKFAQYQKSSVQNIPGNWNSSMNESFRQCPNTTTLTSPLLSLLQTIKSRQRKCQESVVAETTKESHYIKKTSQFHIQCEKVLLKIWSIISCNSHNANIVISTPISYTSIYK